MISLTDAAAVAGIVSNATGIVDKIYERFFMVKSGSTPPHIFNPDQSAVIENKVANGTLVLSKRGAEEARVTYADLSQRLAPIDMRYIQARERVMTLLFEQWEYAYPETAVESDPIRKVQLEQRLKQITDRLGRELTSVLDFIETEVKLPLDDHYYAFRDLASR
jgi:hypothetical protein